MHAHATDRVGPSWISCSPALGAGGCQFRCATLTEIGLSPKCPLVPEGCHHGSRTLVARHSSAWGQGSHRSRRACHKQIGEQVALLLGCWCCWCWVFDGLQRFVGQPASAVFWQAHALLSATPPRPAGLPPMGGSSLGAAAADDSVWATSPPCGAVSSALL